MFFFSSSVFLQPIHLYIWGIILFVSCSFALSAHSFDDFISPCYFSSYFFFHFYFLPFYYTFYSFFHLLLLFCCCYCCSYCCCFFFVVIKTYYCCTYIRRYGIVSYSLLINDDAQHSDVSTATRIMPLPMACISLSLSLNPKHTCNTCGDSIMHSFIFCSPFLLDFSFFHSNSIYETCKWQQTILCIRE